MDRTENDIASALLKILLEILKDNPTLSVTALFHKIRTQLLHLLLAAYGADTPYN